MQRQVIGTGGLRACIPREIVALIEALQFQAASTHRLRELDDAAWKSLLRFSDFAHLTLALAQTPHAGIPSWVEQRLQQNLEHTAIRFERVRVRYREAADALSAAAIPHVVLKGFTQAPEYVRHPRLRAQSDLDFYCPPERIPAASAALERLDYRPVRDREYYRLADHVPTLARPTTWVWKGNIFDPEKPLTIELHFCLWNSNLTKLPIPGVERFWDRRVLRNIDGLHFPALNSVDHLGYLALHTLREVIAGGWMGNHLYEVAGFLHRHADDQEFWREWQSDHDPQLRRFETVVFSMAERWFACRIPVLVRTQMELLTQPLRAWCMRFGAAPLESKFRPNRDGRLLQFLMADTWAAKRVALVRTVVPGRMARPGESVVPPAFRARRGNKYVDYIWYLCRRLVMKPIMLAEFFVHALMVFLAPSVFRSMNLAPDSNDLRGRVSGDAATPSP